MTNDGKRRRAVDRVSSELFRADVWNRCFAIQCDLIESACRLRGGSAVHNLLPVLHKLREQLLEAPFGSRISTHLMILRAERSADLTLAHALLKRFLTEVKALSEASSDDLGGRAQTAAASARALIGWLTNCGAHYGSAIKARLNMFGEILNVVAAWKPKDAEIQIRIAHLRQLLLENPNDPDLVDLLWQLEDE